MTPALFSIPLLFTFLLVSDQYLGIKKVFNLAIYTLLLGSVTYFIAYQKPYCNPMRYEIAYKIDHLFPKLKYIKVSKEIHYKYTEFAFLISKYGNNFKTLIGMPLSNYLTNTNFPIKIDWVKDNETGNEDENIINDLKIKKTVVFLEKKPQLIEIRESITKVAYFIKNNWNKIDSLEHFEVYRFED